MPNDDPVFVLRLQAMSAASSRGSVKLAYQVLDIPHSTFHRCRKQWIRYGLEILWHRNALPGHISCDVAANRPVWSRIVHPAMRQLGAAQEVVNMLVTVKRSQAGWSRVLRGRALDPFAP